MDLLLSEWLDKRWKNALYIANAKKGDDRNGWLEDASYLLRARECAAKIEAAGGDGHENTPLRTWIALSLLRAWNSGTAGYDAEVVLTVNEWFDGGMKGAIPFPKSPFFAQWAAENGLADIGGYVGFKFVANLTPNSALGRGLRAR
jgi:hypothetical protein